MKPPWLSVSLLALGLVVTADAAFAKQPTLVVEVAVVMGVDEGAPFALFQPATWNGDLVLYAHGFVDPAAPVALPDAASVEAAPWLVELRDTLLRAGFAVAYSAFAENGWAVDNGVQLTDRLRGIFAAHFHRPRRTYIIGRSLGALIALRLVETAPPWYSGALALCGPVGGARLQTDYIGHTRVLFDFFFPRVIPGDVLNVPADLDVSTLIGDIVAAIEANPLAAVALASVDQVRLPFTNFPELVNSIVRVLAYHLRGTNDLLARTGGISPFDNTDVVYTGLGPYDAVVNARVGRFAAGDRGLDFLAAFYQPAGVLRLPVLTLHTTLDPDVPLVHQSALADIVAAARPARRNAAANPAQGNGKSPNRDWLVQQRYDRYGHCNFTPAEAAGAFGRLVDWVETGAKPAGGVLASP
jgi:pimeloyl-ACP methyl ester carboxylesterase